MTIYEAGNRAAAVIKAVRFTIDETQREGITLYNVRFLRAVGGDSYYVDSFAERREAERCVDNMTFVLGMASCDVRAGLRK